MAHTVMSMIMHTMSVCVCATFPFQKCQKAELITADYNATLVGILVPH